MIYEELRGYKNYLKESLKFMDKNWNNIAQIYLSVNEHGHGVVLMFNDFRKSSWKFTEEEQKKLNEQSSSISEKIN